MNKISEKIPIKISTVLTSLVASNGLTSAELARRVGITQPVIYRLMTGENENPQLSTLMPIAAYFGIAIDQLLGLSPLPKQYDFDKQLLHDITNKLVTIRTIATILNDVMPSMIEGYQKAVSTKLMAESTALDILPLIMMNVENLLKAANSIQNLLFDDVKTSKDVS